jgi:hypothetical protein
MSIAQLADFAPERMRSDRTERGVVEEMVHAGVEPSLAAEMVAATQACAVAREQERAAAHGLRTLKSCRCSAAGANSTVCVRSCAGRERTPARPPPRLPTAELVSPHARVHQD